MNTGFQLHLDPEVKSIFYTVCGSVGHVTQKLWLNLKEETRVSTELHFSQL